MVRPWRLLRRQPKEKKRPISAESDASTAEKDTNKALRTTVYHVPSLPSRPKEPPPRLELPMDIRSSPFSKATYSPPSSPPYSDIHRLRRIPAMDDMATKAFRLLDLPTELRLSILSHYFGERTMAINLLAAAPAHKRFFSLAHKERKQNVVAVLQSCRRLSKEATEVLWNNTTFVFRIGDHLPLEKLPKPAIPLQRIRHVILNVGYVSKESNIGLYQLLLTLESLNTADVHFDFTAPAFAQSGSGDWIVEEFFNTLKTEKLRRLSCVSQHQAEPRWMQWYHGKELRKLMPYSCSAFEELKRKYQADDVSEDECGCVMEKLSNGIMKEWDTGLLEVGQDSI